MLNTKVYYFGCWDRAGHYLHEPSGRTIHSAGPFTDCNLDGTFPPKMHKPDGSYNERIEDETITVLAHWRGWSVLAMWDRSIDQRGACNAAFVTEGEWTHEIMWELARQHYPQVVARLKASPWASQRAAETP